MSVLFRRIRKREGVKTLDETESVSCFRQSPARSCVLRPAPPSPSCPATLSVNEVGVVSLFPR